MIEFKHMRNLVKDNRGVVPLLTSIFLGVLLSIIAVAFIRLAISERRQATDDDLTTAAFYAAESGLEDARRALREHVLNAATYPESNLNGDTCDAAVGTEPTLGGNNVDSSYTCQLIDLTPEVLLAKPGAGNSHLFKLNAVDGSNSFASMDSIVIKWNDPANDGERNPRPATDTNTLTVGNWTSSSNNYPAMLRINVFAVNRAAGTRLADIQNSGESMTAFINPVNTGPTTHRLTIEDFDSQLLPGGCDNSASSYTCQVTIDLSDDTSIANTGQPYLLQDVLSRYRSSGWIVYLEIQTLYKGDTIQVEAYNGTTQRSFRDAQARVDITGRSGDSFRRVETFLPLDVRSLEVPDEAVVGGDGICKNFFVTNDASEFSTLNPSITGSCRD